MAKKFQIFPHPKHVTSLNVAIKLLIIIALSVAVYIQITKHENLTDLWRNFTEKISAGQTIHFLLLLIFFMPVNWLLETLKWWVLFPVNSNLSFSTLLKAVLAGISIALFTPNRIGEYGGRLLCLKKNDRWDGFIAAVVGSFCQMLVLIGVGLMGVVYLSEHLINWNSQTFYSLVGIVSLLFLAMLGIYFNIGLLVKRLSSLSHKQWAKASIEKLGFMAHYKRQTLLLALLLGTTRYTVYTLQYFWALRFYGVNLNPEEALAGIAGIFLFQTILPLPPVIGLVARGEFALLIWNHFDVNEISIVGATLTLFVINLCIPALIGVLYLLKKNVFKKASYGNENV